MASIRLLKKEINREVAYFIDDCYEYMILHPKKKEAIEPIVDEAVALYDRLIAKVNNRPKGDNIQKHFKEVMELMGKELDALKVKLAKTNAK